MATMRRRRSQTFKKGIKGFEGLDDLDKNLDAIGAKVSDIRVAFDAVDSRIAAHAHLVEFGTLPRMTKSGAYRGPMPPQQFFRPAIDKMKTAAFKHIAAELGKLIEGQRQNPEEILLEGADIIKAEMVRLAARGKTGNLQRGIVAKMFRKPKTQQTFGA